MLIKTGFHQELSRQLRNLPSYHTISGWIEVHEHPLFENAGYKFRFCGLTVKFSLWIATIHFLLVSNQMEMYENSVLCCAYWSLDTKARSNVQLWRFRFDETYTSFSKTLLPIGNKYSSSMSSRIVFFFLFFGCSESDSASGSTSTPCSLTETPSFSSEMPFVSSKMPYLSGEMFVAMLKH